MALQRLKKRRDFLMVAENGRVFATKSMVVQAKFGGIAGPSGSTGAGINSCIRVGFTASRRVGNAVKRNRAKRRLRALVDLHLLPVVKKPVDIVLIARHSTTVVPFAALKSDFLKSLSCLGIK